MSELETVEECFNSGLVIYKNLNQNTIYEFTNIEKLYPKYLNFIGGNFGILVNKNFMKK